VSQVIYTILEAEHNLDKRDGTGAQPVACMHGQRRSSKPSLMLQVSRIHRTALV
jgi:hypothetical protein